jgi:phage/plasmid primase-like uncharacterized protein
MIGFKKIIGGSASSVSALGKHLLNHTLPAEQANVSAYYHRGMKSGVDDVFGVRADGSQGPPVAVVRPNIHPLVADGLGIKIDATLADAAVNGLLAGRRVDGGLIEGKVYAKTRDRGINPKTGERLQSTPIGSYDFCPSPDKTISCAWAFASDTERALIYNAQITAARDAVAYIAQRVGVAHAETNGEVRFEPGHVGWLEFTHFTARRTKVGFDDDGTLRLTSQEVAGDPDIHTHFLIPNAVFCESGRVGSLHTGMIEGFIFDADAYYQGRLAKELMDAGFDVSVENGAATIQGIPKNIARFFSKRSAAGEMIAKEDAKKRGEDWDLIPSDERTERVRKAAHDYEQQRAKGGKDDVANFASWHEQARRFGWTPPQTFMRQEEKPELSDQERHTIGYEAALPFLSKKLAVKSVLTQWDVREAAGRGLIAVGTKDLSDIGVVTQMMRDQGVEQDGRKTALVWGHEEGRRFVSVTTELHESQEKEFISLAQKLSADRSGAIPKEILESAILESGLSFDSEAGKQQLDMIRRLGSSGRFAVAIAAAGAGKTAALKPIVAARKQMGLNTYGASVAWRQADELIDAGIDPENIRALSVLMADLPNMKLGRTDAVAVDELSLVGTEGLELLRMADKYGFSIKGLGDPKQCAAMGAGSFIGLTQKAIPDQVPELTITQRQHGREKVIVGLLREGRAKEALDMKREDGTAELVPGDYDKVVTRTAKLYMERLRATGLAPSVSAPTNYDAHRVSLEIRNERRLAGLIGKDDLKVVRAGDNEGRQYGLALAVGDKVRLFKSTGARFSAGRGGNIGRNGSVLEVHGISDAGLTVKSVKTGRVGFVSWGSLVAKDGPSKGRVLLAYADCMTIHSSQGSTSKGHILTLPGGSQSINGLQGYSGGTRHTEWLAILTSDVAERLEVIKRRPLNDQREITLDDKWANVGRNLAYQPEKDLAVSMLERVESVRRGTVNRFQSSLHAAEAGRKRGAISKIIKMREAAAAQQQPATAVAPPPEAPKEQQSPAPKPEAPKPKPMSMDEAALAFGAEASRIGLRLAGPPIADGAKHPVPVEGNRGKRKSGFYRFDGRTGFAMNSKTGEVFRWHDKAAVPVSAAQQEQDRAARAERQRLREELEERTAVQAQAIWKAAVPASPSHPYLARKDIAPDDLRQAAPGQAAVYETDGEAKQVSIKGRLIVPLRDIGGKIWNLQMIDSRGGKMFLSGRKQGLFTTIGASSPESEPVVVAEGYATAATLRSVTGLRSVVAFDAGNILPVAEAIRRLQPERPIIIAGDNDHQAPLREKPLPNVGVEKAAAAAAAVGGIAVIPPFDPTDKGTDWNDHAAKHGLDGTREALEAALEGIQLPPMPDREQRASEPTTQQQRDAAREVSHPRRYPRPITPAQPEQPRKQPTA